MSGATTDPVVVVVAGYAGVMAANRLGDVRLLMTGGEFVVWAEAFFRPISVATVRNLHAAAVFMSASAVAGGVIYHPAAEAAELKREMLAASLKVLYADHTKFTPTALRLRRHGPRRRDRRHRDLFRDHGPDRRGGRAGRPRGQRKALTEAVRTGRPRRRPR